MGARGGEGEVAAKGWATSVGRLGGKVLFSVWCTSVSASGVRASSVRPVLLWRIFYKKIGVGSRECRSISDDLGRSN